jgi:hypothetical protein
MPAPPGVCSMRARAAEMSGWVSVDWSWFFVAVTVTGGSKVGEVALPGSD